jgi:hypothetical protein
MGAQLTGVQQERGTFLYLENIKVDDESFKQVGKMVKEYAITKGIRVMSNRVIKNRYCHDSVGCKVLVPESQEHIALNPDTWPSQVSCRRWENQPPTYNRRDNRYWNRDRYASQEEYHYESDSWRDT